MPRIVMPNKICERGVSLVEVMIALIVLLIVFMGLVQASLVTIQSNMKNVIRDEAVQVTSQRMTDLKALSFDDGLLNDTGGAFVEDVEENRDIRNVAGFPFTIERFVEDLDADGDRKQILLRTTWDWQGETYTHSISSLRARQ
jgi:prepilin-type N-terminal cleavage/methylation domain-containing protein